MRTMTTTEQDAAKTAFAHIGDWFFRHRNYVFPAMLVLLALVFTPVPLWGDPKLDWVLDLAGIAVCMLGSGLRLWVIALSPDIRHGGFRKEAHAEVLITEGPFGICRNPLYVCNAIVLSGMLLVHGSPWVIGLGMLSFGFAYVTIVVAEEHYLAGRFGEGYARYRRDVNRFWPSFARLVAVRKDMVADWRRALVKDFAGLYVWAAAVILLRAYAEVHWGQTPLSFAALAPYLAALLAGAALTLVLRAFRKSGGEAAETPSEQFTSRIFLSADESGESEPEPELQKELDGPALALLGECLSLENSSASLQGLRIRLLADRTIWPRLFNMAELFGLLPVLAERLQALVLVPPRAANGASGTLQPHDVVEQARASIRAYRANVGRQLKDILTIWNAIGIEPLLIKGVHSIWTGTPDWRDMADLDLLVPRDRARDAEAALIDAGYEEPVVGFRLRPWSHHLYPLRRDGQPCKVEIHYRAANRYAETLLPTGELWAAARPMEKDGVRAFTLPRGLHLLHGLLHHHVGHRGDAMRLIHVRGLYEFAWAFQRLNADELAELSLRSKQNLRIAISLDVWIASANQLFAMPVPPPFELHEDALVWWRETLAHTLANEPRGRLQQKFAGLGQTLALARNAARAQGAGYPATGLGRLSALRSVIGSVIQPKLAGFRSEEGLEPAPEPGPGKSEEARQ